MVILLEVAEEGTDFGGLETAGFDPGVGHLTPRSTAKQ